MRAHGMPAREEQPADPASPGPAVDAPVHGTTREALRRFADRHRTILLAFALSRLLVLVVGFGAELVARMADIEPFRPFAHAATYVHYADVVARGYVFDGAGGAFDNTTQYPLLPAILWLGQAIGIPLPVTVFVTANLCFLVALLLVARIGERYVGPQAARRGVVYLAFVPFAQFFSLASTESFMLLALAGSVLLALRATPASWLAAGGVAAICAVARPPGAFVGIVLLAIAIGQLWRGQLSRRGIAAALAAGAAIPAAVVGFFAYLGARTGDPLASVHAQSQFNREVTLDGPLRALLDGAALAVSGVPGQAIELAATIGAAGLLLWFAASAAGERAEVRGWTAFGIASLALPLASGVLYQMPRFALLVPPLFWAAGALVGARRRLHVAALVVLPMGLAATVVAEVVGVT